MSAIDERLHAAGEQVLGREDARSRDRVRQRLFHGPSASRTVGRFIIGRRVGAGASGEVFEAFDPELQRSVALKVLRGDRHQGADRRVVQARMTREARALAKLGHPNVVEVFDVGIADERVYIAMELVGGGSLRDWQQATPRAWGDIVDLYVQAGRGLAAAHAAGLVHRDVKPSNILVGDDGRVRLIDFGLVAARGDPAPTLPRPTPGDTTCSVSSSLTATGLHVGTRGYMAPEQALGGLASPAADQFGLCVALWEALHGQRPFASQDPVAMAREVLAREIVSHSERDVPRRLQAVLRRGLSAAPADRWPSMERFITELVALRRRQPRRRLAAIGVLGVLAVAGGIGVQPGEHADSSPCDGPRRTRELWSEELAQALQHRFTTQAPTIAPATWAFVGTRIDDVTKQWRDTQRAVCQEHARGQRSDDEFDRAMHCLHGQRRELQAALDVLAEADAEVVRRAHVVVGELSSPDACRDPATAGSIDPATDPAWAQVARAATLRRAGRYAEALAGSRAIVDSATSRDSLLAAARVEQGQALAELGRFAAAREVLEDGYFLARETTHEPATLEAATRLTLLWGVTADDREQGLRWAQHGWASLERYPDPRGRARLLERQARVLSSAGRLARARADAEASLALWEDQLGPTDPRTADALEVMATTLSRAGQYDDAASYIERAHDVREQTLGSEHPETSMTLTFLASIEDDRGRTQQAEVLLREALERLERAVGPEHPYVATVLTNLAATMFRVRDYATAEPLLLRAKAILERGEEGTTLAMVLHDLGVLAALDGRTARAQQLIERGRELLVRTRGADHPLVGQALQALGGLARGQGQLDQAERSYAEAMAIYVRRLGADHPSVAHLLGNRARLALDRGKLDSALEHAHQALRLRERRLGTEHPDTLHSRELVQQVEAARRARAEATAPTKH
ncbi:MAG: serine/threonine-protein kinase [Nannocystaceae bacterium]